MAGEVAVLTPEELAAAKRYMRPDFDGDDETLADCVLAARGYLEGAGVRLPPAGTLRRKEYDVVCHSLALGSYDLREPVITGTIINENLQLRKTLTSLKLTEPRP